MRKYYFSLRSNLLLLAFASLLFTFNQLNAQVGIGTTSPNAMLDIHMDQPVVNGVTGFLVPRVSSMYAGVDDNGDGIVDDIEPGLMVYYTGTDPDIPNTFYVHHRVHGWQTIMEAGSDPCPTAGIDNVSDTQELSCAVPEIILSASGVGTYKWKNSNNEVIGTDLVIVVSEPDTYTLEVTKNGCSDTAVIEITQDVLEVGDYDCVNKGVVVWVNSGNSNNYKIISMLHLDRGGDNWDEFKHEWGDDGEDDFLGATSDDNGAQNTQIWINAYNNGNGRGSSEHAPYLAYYHDPNNTGGNDNWYLPARDELYALLNSNSNVITAINNSLQNNGGHPILNREDYWSSTEFSYDKAYRIKVDNGQVIVDDEDKDKNEYARAFKEIGG